MAGSKVAGMVVSGVHRLAQLVKTHIFIICAALVLVSVIFYPLISFPRYAGANYKGINIAHFGSDEHFYLTRAKEVLEGHNLGNVVLREGKNEHDHFFMYTERVLITPLRWLGLSGRVDIVNIYNTYNFIGIIFLILLIYGFVLQLKNNRRLAAATSLFVVGGYSIVYNKTLFYTDFNIYGRAMFPYISSIIFFVYLNALAYFVQHRSRWSLLLAGITFGVLFYVYFFAWTFASALNACLSVVYLLEKKFKQCKEIILITILGLLLGSYNLYKLFTFIVTPAGKQLSYFQWSSIGHGPIFSKIGAITFALFVIFYFLRKKDANQSFIVALILAGWVALNQQVLSGRVLQYGHYYWYFIVPVSIIVGLYMLWELVTNTIFRTILSVVLVALVFINTAVGQYRSAKTTLDEKMMDQLYAPLLAKLNSEPEPGVVLAADDENANLVTVYTNKDLFWSVFAPTYHTSPQRFRDALYLYLYLNQNSRENFKGYIATMMSSTTGSMYKVVYENIEGYWSGWDYYTYQSHVAHNDSEVQTNRAKTLAVLTPEYTMLAKDEANMAYLLESYGVTHILWDSKLYPEWDLSFVPVLEEIERSGPLILYRVQYAPEQ